MADGKGTGPFPPLDGSAIANGPAAEHVKMVLGGKNLMPAFAGQLSDADIAAVITYERNSWGNATGDVVQPADVKAAR
jgi:cytochrome c oxidase subunit 2